MNDYEVVLTGPALARLSGISLEEIRRLTEQSLLPVRRTTRLGPLYTVDAVDVIAFLRSLARLGFVPGEVRFIMAVIEAVGGDADEIGEMMRERALNIRADIESLARIDEALECLAEQCGSAGGYLAGVAAMPQQCDVLQA